MFEEKIEAENAAIGQQPASPIYSMEKRTYTVEEIQKMLSIYY